MTSCGGDSPDAERICHWQIPNVLVLNSELQNTSLDSPPLPPQTSPLMILSCSCSEVRFLAAWPSCQEPMEVVQWSTKLLLLLQQQGQAHCLWEPYACCLGCQLSHKRWENSSSKSCWNYILFINLRGREIYRDTDRHRPSTSGSLSNCPQWWRLDQVEACTQGA